MSTRSLIGGALLALLLSGCGLVYNTPSVPRDEGRVRVLALTAESVLAANRSAYVPRSLPAMFGATAAAAGPAAPDGPAPSASLRRPVRPGRPALAAPPPVPPAPYEIGVGDVLLLATRETGSTVEALSGLLAASGRRQGYTVQDDGAIAIPDIGRVPLAGLTLEQAEDALFQALVANNIDPTFSLEVAEFNSRRVSVGGAVGRPGVVPVTLVGLTLDAALAGAGGIAVPDRDVALIRISRGGRLYQIPVRDYLARPGLQKTVLAAGDGVFVDPEFDLDAAQAYFAEQIALAGFRAEQRERALARLQAEVALRRGALDEARGNFRDRLAFDAVDRDYVYLAGEVANPSRFALPFGRQATLADALFGQGGFDVEVADPGQIYVLRPSDRPEDLGAVTAWWLDATNAANLTVAGRMELRPGDVIFIAEQPITTWNRSISQLVPQIVGIGAARSG